MLENFRKEMARAHCMGAGGGAVSGHRGMQDIYSEIYDVGEGSEVGVGRREATVEEGAQLLTGCLAGAKRGGYWGHWEPGDSGGEAQGARAGSLETC